MAVNNPFKQKLAVALNDWLLNYPGKTIGIVTPAYITTHSPRNITLGFSKPEIVPFSFSRNAFTNEDFEYAEVTKHPQQPVVCAEVTNRVETEETFEIEADSAVLDNHLW